MSIRFIVDSSCDHKGLEDPRLTILPLSIAFADTLYRDGVDITNERFYELLVESEGLPTTGQVTPFAFSQAIEAAQADGVDGIVVVTLSSKLSGTHQSALIAAHEAGGEAAGVYVVDSLSATVGLRALVELGLSLADRGLTAEEVARELVRAREDVVLVALLDTLEYLRRGGRVPAATAALGELLSIKPVIAVEDGEVAVRGKARGSKNGRNLLTREVERAGGVDVSRPICLGYSGLTDSLLRKYIEDSRALWEGKVDMDRVSVDLVGATIGTHVGPGAIALAFFRAR